MLGADGCLVLGLQQEGLRLGADGCLVLGLQQVGPMLSADGCLVLGLQQVGPMLGADVHLQAFPGLQGLTAVKTGVQESLCNIE